MVVRSGGQEDALKNVTDFPKGKCCSDDHVGLPDLLFLMCKMGMIILPLPPSRGY